jgi:hypothetical protein
MLAVALSVDVGIERHGSHLVKHVLVVTQGHFDKSFGTY